MTIGHSPVGHEPIPWVPMFAGLCASMVGIGLARFAYTPLIPPMIEAGWFRADSVIYLGAANLAGYLVGALIARPLGRRLGNVALLKAMMLLTALAFFACAFPLSVSWFFAWRLLSGITGGVIMVLVAATLLPGVPARLRGFASGAIFLGVGLGIAASGTLVPLLLNWGLVVTWQGLGALSLALVVASWRTWPAKGAVGEAVTATPEAPRSGATRTVNLLYLQYGLMAVGLVPAVVFLVDFLARGRNLGAHVGAVFWVVYGLGSIFGPPIYGHLADKLGNALATRLLLLVQIAAMLLLVNAASLWIAGFAIWVIGTFPPGIVPLVLHKVHHVLPGDPAAQAVTWSRATVAFAAFQALAGYGYSWLFTRSGGEYALLFSVGAAALVLALALDLADVGKRRRARSRE